MRPQKIHSIPHDAHTDAFLVSNLTNILFLSGVGLSHGFLLITDKKSTLFVDGRYTEKALKEANKDIKIADISTLLTVMKNVKMCGFEAQTVNVEQWSNWKKNMKNTKFVQKKDIVEFYRRSKGKNEIQHFKKAQKITQEVLRNTQKYLQVGITEKELAWKLETSARVAGADCLSFDPIIAFGTHTSRPHHSPTDRKLKKGHIVQVDIGAKVNGYCADQSAVFFTAKKTAEQKRVYMALKRAKSESIALIKSGVTNHELDACARRILSEENLEQYFTHSLGHGVGLDIHEGITLSLKAAKTPLLKNEIITIEPGVYIPGKFGMRLEEEIIVK